MFVKFLILLIYILSIFNILGCNHKKILSNEIDEENYKASWLFIQYTHYFFFILIYIYVYVIYLILITTYTYTAYSKSYHNIHYIGKEILKMQGDIFSHSFSSLKCKINNICIYLYHTCIYIKIRSEIFRQINSRK